MNPARRSRRHTRRAFASRRSWGPGARSPPPCIARDRHRHWCVADHGPNTSRRPTPTCSLSSSSGFSAGCFLPATGRRRSGNDCIIIGVFFVAAALFWSVFEQAGSTLNLFADRSTEIVVLATVTSQAAGGSRSMPCSSSCWRRSSRGSGCELGTPAAASPTKFALGLVGVGIGFLDPDPGSADRRTGVKVGRSWLIFVYLMHTLAELCLSPVGLSSMTKLAPPRVVSP